MTDMKFSMNEMLFCMRYKLRFHGKIVCDTTMKAAQRALKLAMRKNVHTILAEYVPVLIGDSFKPFDV